MDERFATVGPFFKINDPEYLKRYIDVFFPNCPPLLIKVAEHALASLIYHYNYLCIKLAPNSILRDTVLFTQPEFQISLKEFVITSVLTNSLDPNIPLATGIPPYVLIMKQNRALLEQNEKLSLELGEVTEKVVQGVNQILEERALQTNSVTPQSMETMLNGLVERILPGLHDFNMQRPDQQNVEVAPEILQNVQEIDGRRYQAFDWGQLNFQPIPVGYSVPNGVVRNMWLHWMCENTVTIDENEYRVRPLRRISKLKPRNISELIQISRDFSALKNLSNAISGTSCQATH
jgi:Fe-S cluster biosynthesis and repair protein YggX